jgi:triosephosphate isomerase
MNKTRAEAAEYARSLIDELAPSPVAATVFVLPPFTALDRVGELARGTPLKVGAQNMHWADAGPYTGEVSPLMVRECGATLVELGHFERRLEFNETSSSVNKKVCAALRHDLVPLICVGETAAEREQSVAEDVVSCQVRIALHGVGTDQVPRVLIAYEPGWAIGETGTEADATEVNAMHRRIRCVIESQHGAAVSEQVHILYGGSITNANAPGYALQPEIDGLFIGRAALDVGSFVSILRTFCDHRSGQRAQRTETQLPRPKTTEPDHLHPTGPDARHRRTSGKGPTQ